MKKHKRIIKGVAFLFVVMLVVFLGANVDAAEKKTVKDTCENESELKQYYGAAITVDSLNQFTLTVQKGTFKVDRVVAGENYLISQPTQMGTVSSNRPLRIAFKDITANDVKITLHLVLAKTDTKCMSKDDFDKAEKENKTRATFDMDVSTYLPNKNSTSGTPVDNTNINGVCKVLMQGVDYEKYKSKLPGITAEDVANYNYKAVDKTGKGHYDTTVAYCQQQKVQFNYTEDQTASMIASAMDSWKKLYFANMPGDPLPEGFDAAFNYAKEQALAIPGHHFENPFKTSSDIRKGITVDPLKCDWKKEATASKGDNYYVNKDYYYASQKDTITADYTYHYTGADKPKPVSNAVCERTCEESVVVEYGPPVASKAGLCFEYKVRVTSRVKCKSDIKAQPPTPPSVCTPVPICNEIPGYIHQGGPKEEFDACISKCDGGKYTQACSNKCYKEVYGKDSSTKLALSYDNVVAKKVASDGDCDGVYTKSQGSIGWSGNGYGRWYCEQHYETGEPGYGLYDGFKKAHGCGDPCHWVGCEGDTYLNKEEAAADQVRNLAEYNKAISVCKAAASCSTRTSEMEITATYNHKDGNTIKTTDPFTESKAENKSTLPSLGNGGTTNNTTNKPSSPNIFIPDTNPKGYAGCYEKTSAKNWYQAEWSFPGTWIHNKTGDISFVDQSKENAWHYKKNKFCVPLNALSINTKWWEWSQIKKDCFTEPEIANSIDYNIKAQTKNFGYFGWNIKLSCFYALRNEVCDTTVNGCCNPNPDPPSGDGTTKGPKNFTFRIVDTSDLFPAANGSSTIIDSDKTTTVTGRKPGFNWTDEAKNTKNSDYLVSPLALIGKIQERRDSIYDSEQYLDYSFILTTEDLKEIRKDYNDDKKYTSYSGTTEIKNGITVYTSKLISKYVNGNHRGNIGCNNDGIGSECEKIGVE